GPKNGRRITRRSNILNAGGAGADLANRGLRRAGFVAEGSARNPPRFSNTDKFVCQHLIEFASMLLTAPSACAWSASGGSNAKGYPGHMFPRRLSGQTCIHRWCGLEEFTYRTPFRP